jgi:hypothetical protein
MIDAHYYPCVCLPLRAVFNAFAASVAAAQRASIWIAERVKDNVATTCRASKFAVLANLCGQGSTNREAHRALSVSRYVLWTFKQSFFEMKPRDAEEQILQHRLLEFRGLQQPAYRWHEARLRNINMFAILAILICLSHSNGTPESLRAST